MTAFLSIPLFTTLAPSSASSTGPPAPLAPDVHDQIYGIGPQIGVTYLPWKAAGTFKWTHDFGVRDRFEGENFTLNFAVAF